MNCNAEKTLQDPQQSGTFRAIFRNDIIWGCFCYYVSSKNEVHFER